jgi:hypothetical protein
MLCRPDNLDTAPRGGPAADQVNAVRLARLYRVAVKNVITAFKASYLELERLFKSVEGGLKERKLIGKKRKSTLTVDDESYLRETAQTLMRLLRIGEVDKLEALTKNPLAMINILRSFYRVVEILAVYEGKGKATF